MFSSSNDPGRALLALGLLSLVLAVPRARAADPAEQGIIFAGTAGLPESALREAAAAELARYHRQGHRPADADDAAFQMEQAYRRAGFAFAAVRYQQETEAGKPALRFIASEGPRVEVKAIELEGNSAFADGVLRSFYQSGRLGFLGLGPRSFDQAVMEAGARAIRDFYLTQGFLEVRVDPPRYEFSPDRRQVLVRQAIREGVGYRIEGVEISGDVLGTFLDGLGAIQQDLQGEPYYRRQALTLEDRILQLYGNEGYVDTAVTVEPDLNSATGRVFLRAQIRSGLPVTLARVEVTGNTVTQAAFIASRVPLEIGRPLRLDRKNQGFSNLYATGLFSQVELTLAKTADPRERVLRVAVQEVPYKELYVEAGYGSYEMLRGLAGFKEKNIFGTGRIFRAEGGASFKGEHALAGVTDPWFLNTEVTGDLTVQYRRRQEPAYVSQELAGIAKLSRRFLEHGFLSLDYTLRSTILFDVEADADLGGLVNNFQTGALILQAYYDTRDNPIYPSLGQKTGFSAEFANPSLGSQIRYYRLTLGTQGYLRVTSSSVLALRYNTGLIVPGEGLDVVPLSLRFYNGGANSVRSFQEHALGPADPLGVHTGGLAYNVVNLEWRQHLAGDFGVNLFFDSGNISPNGSRQRVGVPVFATRAELIRGTLAEYFADFRSALGAGLEYYLPIGPARLDLGFNPSPSSLRNEAAYAVHFSLGLVF